MSPPQPRIVIINSTLGFQQSATHGCEPSPLHHWGWPPGMGDKILVHSKTRFGIVSRYRLGFDIRLLFLTLKSLQSHASGVYLVTPPDLLKAVPLVKRLFPKKPLVGWTWTAADVKRDLKILRHFDGVLALTDGAYSELSEQGFGSRGALGIWGCPQAAYRPKDAQASDLPQTYDIGIFGLSKRDWGTINAVAADDQFTVAVSKRVQEKLQAGRHITALEVSGPGNFSQALRSCAACLIPICKGEEEPVGYTNLIESLHCGTPVVIPRHSTIPRRVLSLPGVFTYLASDSGSLHHAIESAKIEGRDPARRRLIMESADQHLSGEKMRAQLQKWFGTATTEQRPHMS
jgi:glycosyltransferase involved in cell wall biosynthesis